MRGTRKLILTVGALIAAAVGVLPISPLAQTSPSTQDQLRARRAQLVAQLAALEGPRGGAAARLSAAEQQLGAVQDQLAAVRRHLDSTNNSLSYLARRIADDESTVGTARVQLAELIRATYESSAGDGFVTAILDAGSFNEAMDRLKGAAHVTDQVRQLEADLASRQAALVRERADLQRDFAEARLLEGQLSDQGNHMMALVAQRDQAYRALDGPARAIAGQIAEIDLELQGQRTVNAAGPCGNHFAFGYCTYYVATRRCIPWFGNAWEWWGNAAAFGYAEGHVPQRGAVAVWGRYGSSPDGHVAYVEAVGPSGNVPAGYFLVSEMNYAGWDRVDYRQVPDNAPGLLGFIYGKN